MNETLVKKWEKAKKNKCCKPSLLTGVTRSGVGVHQGPLGVPYHAARRSLLFLNLFDRFFGVFHQNRKIKSCWPPNTKALFPWCSTGMWHPVVHSGSVWWPLEMPQIIHSEVDTQRSTRLTWKSTLTDHGNTLRHVSRDQEGYRKSPEKCWNLSVDSGKANRNISNNTTDP